MIGNLIICSFIAVWAALSVFLWRSFRSRGNTLLNTFLRTFTADILICELWVGVIRYHDLSLLLFILMLQKIVLTLVIQAVRSSNERKMHSAQIEMYRHEMEIMEQSQQQISFLRHDMKNHIQHIDRLLRNNETDSLLKYIGDISASLENPDEFVRSGNHDIDSMLNYKLMTAKNMGAEIMTEVKIPAELDMPAFDINVILGNLLDNAVEAMSGCKVRKIAVLMRYDAGMLHIAISNSCSGKPTLVSAKGAGHGIGLHSIRSTVDKYHGDMKLDSSDGQFTASVMMYIG